MFFIRGKSNAVSPGRLVRLEYEDFYVDGEPTEFYTKEDAAWALLCVCRNTCLTIDQYEIVERIDVPTFCVVL